MRPLSAPPVRPRQPAQVLLDKFKEKNAAVGRSIHEALSAMHKHCFTLADVAEQLAGEPAS